MHLALLLAALSGLSGPGMNPDAGPGTLVLSCSACVLAQAGPEEFVAPPGLSTPAPAELAPRLSPPSRELELRRDIATLDMEIRSISIAWPTGAVVMAAVGYVFGPFILFGLPILIAGLVFVGDPDFGGGGLLLAGGVLTGIGVVGLIFLIKGIIEGVTTSKGLRQRKDALRDERRTLQLELNDLLRGGSTVRAGARRPRVLPLLALRF